MATPLVDNTGKPLTTQQIWAQVDWTSRSSIQTTFPTYMRELLSFKTPPSKAIRIESFSMKTPYGDRFLLQDTDLILEANKRQALFGANATGKSLLFRNMNTEYGQIKNFPKHLLIHHCKEFENHELANTVLDTVVNAHPFRQVLLQCHQQLESELQLSADDTTRCEALKDNLNYIQFQMRTIGAYDTKDRACKMLRVLGFDDYGQNKLVSELSGGLRMRVALCMAFMIEPDLLLLDEPTNHLDFPSVLWLENRLRGYKSSFLLVSHDRELLNNVCTSVLLLEDQKIKYYNSDFKTFEKTKAKEDQKKYDDIEKFLQKNQNCDPSTLLGRQKQDKKQWSEHYHQKQIALKGKFTFPVAVPLSSNINNDAIELLKIDQVRFSYKPETNIFIFDEPIDFTITPTTRCGIMGPNGAGKSTLLKLLTEQHLPTSGQLHKYPNFSLAYFGQYSTHELDLEKTATEWMAIQFPNELASGLRQHLAKTSIVGIVQDTRMDALSFSQKSCIVFSKLTYKCPHLLILDEPTNFLDLESVDSLISACNKYTGALLLVSHNRDFLKKCAKTYLSVVPGKFLIFDNMKDAERSTYTFISEMEEGVSVSAQDLVKKNAGGGSLTASQKLTTNTPPTKDNLISTTKTHLIPATKTHLTSSLKDMSPTYVVGEKVQALWTDNKWYSAIIKKVIDPKYQVTYTQYGNTITLESKSLRKLTSPQPPKSSV